jgi:hypothetical protein
VNIIIQFVPRPDGGGIGNQPEPKLDIYEFASQDEATLAIAKVISRCGAKTVKVDTFRVDRVVENP